MKFPYLEFFGENSILAYISLKIAKLGKIGNYDVIVTAYTEYLYFFSMYGKRRAIAILWYQISIPQAFIFQVYKRKLQQPLLVSRVAKNSLVRRGLNVNVVCEFLRQFASGWLYHFSKKKVLTILKERTKHTQIWFGVQFHFKILKHESLRLSYITTCNRW